MGFPFINHPFGGTPIVGNLHMANRTTSRSDGVWLTRPRKIRCGFAMREIEASCDSRELPNALIYAYLY